MSTLAAAAALLLGGGLAYKALTSAQRRALGESLEELSQRTREEERARLALVS